MAGEDTDDGPEPGLIDDLGPDELIGDDRLAPTPEQHERLKQKLHGGRFDDVRRATKRYLVIGRGEGDLGARRQRVRDLLDGRRDASAFQLEDFGFESDDLDLWVPAFEILSEMASHVVGVLEDFDGGHVWELGYLYRYQTGIRNVLWLLKRVYETAEAMRDRYDNGMAASHLAALEQAAADRVITWQEPADLPEAVAAIP